MIKRVFSFSFSFSFFALWGGGLISCYLLKAQGVFARDVLYSTGLFFFPLLMSGFSVGWVRLGGLLDSFCMGRNACRVKTR